MLHRSHATSGYVGSSQLRKQKPEAAGSSGAVQALRMENDAPVVGPDAPTADSSQPRRAASMTATSIFFIVIIASKARFASTPPAASASVSARGVICQERPQRSLHQTHALSTPPLPTIAFQ